jgi:hypothetical protein
MAGNIARFITRQRRRDRQLIEYRWTAGPSNQPGDTHVPEVKKAKEIPLQAWTGP